MVVIQYENERGIHRCQIIGQISGKVVDIDAIKRLAKLPGKDVLLAQTLSAMQAVPASFVRVLNGVVVKLLNVLTAIEQQKAKGDTRQVVMVVLI